MQNWFCTNTVTFNASLKLNNPNPSHCARSATLCARSSIGNHSVPDSTLSLRTCEGGEQLRQTGYLSNFEYGLN
eukprot:3902948-Rhodomonas_salina.1